jgi:hypothetical protein
MDEEQRERAVKIAALNDRFRGMAIDVHLTQGVIYTIADVVGLLKKVETFSDFTEDNDPYGEHDFGSLEHVHKVFWKIDYFDKELKQWCDPLDPNCRRIMTVMLASEY